MLKKSTFATGRWYTAMADYLSSEATSFQWLVMMRDDPKLAALVWC